ncbi:MAG: urease subunit gamma [Actinomycetes bacterium]
MDLTPSERDRLLLAAAADLARRRRARGLLLNVPEATAIIADSAAEAARDGLRLADAIEAGRTALTVADVLPGVAEVIDRVAVEAVFDDGTRLVVIPSPLGSGDGQGPGSILIDAPDETFGVPASSAKVTVINTSTVPISVTSHFHFFEVNPRLSFDRATGYGMRLAIAAGTSVRFDPGASVDVALTAIGGDRVMIGFAGLVDGPLDAPGAKEQALERARATGYLGADA